MKFHSCIFYCKIVEASFRGFYNRTLLNSPVMVLSRQQCGSLLPQKQDWDVIWHQYNVLSIIVINTFKDFLDFKVLTKRVTEELQRNDTSKRKGSICCDATHFPGFDKENLCSC